MTSEQIKVFGIGHHATATETMLREIAYQLAVANERQEEAHLRDFIEAMGPGETPMHCFEKGPGYACAVCGLNPQNKIHN